MTVTSTPATPVSATSAPTSTPAPVVHASHRSHPLGVTLELLIASLLPQVVSEFVGGNLSLSSLAETLGNLGSHASQVNSVIQSAGESAVSAPTVTAAPTSSAS